MGFTYLLLFSGFFNVKILSFHVKLFNLFYFIVLSFHLELDSGDGGAGESGDLGFSQWLENIQGKPGLWV